MIIKRITILIGSLVFFCGSLHSKDFYEYNVAEHIASEALNEDRMFAIIKRYEYRSGDHSLYRFEDGSRIWGEIPAGAEVSEFRSKNNIRPLLVEADFCGHLDSTVFVGTPPTVTVLGQGKPTYVGLSGPGSRWFVIGEDVMNANGDLKDKYEDRFGDIADVIPLQPGRLLFIDEPRGLNIYSLKFTSEKMPPYLVQLGENEINDLSRILRVVCSLRSKNAPFIELERIPEVLHELAKIENDIESEFGMELMDQFLQQLAEFQISTTE